jgi:hypothetical protein
VRAKGVVLAVITAMDDRRPGPHPSDSSNSSKEAICGKMYSEPHTALLAQTLDLELLLYSLAGFKSLCYLLLPIHPTVLKPQEAQRYILTSFSPTHPPCSA